jgi:rhomboid protease GluP
MYIAGRCGTDLVLAQGQYWRLLTSVFLHAGLSHLGSNLLVQILMGNAVERNLGHVRYLALYLLSGIGGNVISVLYDRAQGVNIYSVGASGAVFGVMGTLIILILRGRKKLRSGSSLLPRAAFAVFYAVYSGFRNPYTDNAAHLGGLLFGAALGTLLTVTLEDVDLQDLR